MMTMQSTHDANFSDEMAPSMLDGLSLSGPMPKDNGSLQLSYAIVSTTHTS